MGMTDGKQGFPRFVLQNGSFPNYLNNHLLENGHAYGSDRVRLEYWDEVWCNPLAGGEKVFTF